MLTEDQKDRLVEAAAAARQNAYAPYSGYAVGAALLSADGRIFTGVNVENAAYPNGICAERVAVFKAISEGVRNFTAIAVLTKNGGTPCGACRQVLAEFGVDLEVVIAEEGPRILKAFDLRELLPDSFGPDDLTAAARLAE